MVNQHFVHILSLVTDNNAFLLARATVTVSQFFVHILSLVTDNNPLCISGREENDHRNYFMTNLH